MRPILVGITLFFVGMIGWMTFKILGSIRIGYFCYFSFPFITEMFKFIAVLSIPISLMFEILLALMKRE